MIKIRGGKHFTIERCKIGTTPPKCVYGTFPNLVIFLYLLFLSVSFFISCMKKIMVWQNLINIFWILFIKFIALSDCCTKYHMDIFNSDTSLTCFEMELKIMFMFHMCVYWLLSVHESILIILKCTFFFHCHATLQRLVMYLTLRAQYNTPGTMVGPGFRDRTLAVKGFRHFIFFNLKKYILIFLYSLVFQNMRAQKD